MLQQSRFQIRLDDSNKMENKNLSKMGKVSFLVGVVLRLVAVAFVFYIAAIPLSIFLIRAHEGLQDDP